MSTMQRFDVRTAAVVVIDVQNDYCHPEGVQGRRGRDLSRVAATVTNIESLCGQARHLGVPIYLVYTTHSAEVDSAEWLARRPGNSDVVNCLAGSWGAQLYGLQPARSDHLVEKHRYSAFVGTDLEAMIKQSGRRSLLFCGYASAACVETSLRDAVCRDFLATFVSDCCDSYDPDSHDRAVLSVQQGFGLVATSTDILAAWNAEQRSALVDTH